MLTLLYRLSTLLYFIDRKRYFKEFLVFSVILFFINLISSLSKPGFDIISYKNYYDDGVLTFEPGYQLLTWVMMNFNFPFFSIQLLYIALFLYTVSKIVKSKISVELLIASCCSVFFVLTTFNGLRQGFAITLILLALEFIQTKSKIFAFFLIFIAISFHYSSVLFAPILYFSMFNRRFLAPLLITVFLLIMSLSILGKYIPLIDYYSFYLNNSFLGENSSRFGPYLKILYFFIYIFFTYRTSNYNTSKLLILSFLLITYLVTNADELVARLLMAIYTLNLIDILKLYQNHKKPGKRIGFELFSLNSISIF